MAKLDSHKSTHNHNPFQLQLQLQHEIDLIPNLPNDLALQCLLRLPYTSFPTLKQISTTFNSTLSHPTFFSLRRHFNLSNHLLFLIQPPHTPPTTTTTTTKHRPHTTINHPNHSLTLFNFNFNHNHNHNHHTLNFHHISLPIPPTFSQCVSLHSSSKLIILGGWDPLTLQPLNRVLIFDLIKGTFKQGSSMPTPRSFFSAVASPDSTVVYVAGGHDRHKNALRSAEAYDVATDKWRKLPDMGEERDECHGFCFSNSNEFWVVSGYGTDSQGRFRSDSEVFDPDKGIWYRVEGVWPYNNTSPKTSTMCGGGEWWLVVRDGELKEFKWGEMEWKRVKSGRVPNELNGSSFIELMNVGDDEGSIFVMGNGMKDDEEIDEQIGFFLRRKNDDDEQLVWEKVCVPSRFMGLPFSACSVFI